MVSVGINSDNMCISEPNEDNMMKNFSEALVTRVSSMRDSSPLLGLDILTPTRGFISARSSDWGRGLDVSSSAVAVLNWEVYDDVRGIQLLTVATFFSLNESVERSESSLRSRNYVFPWSQHRQQF